MQYEINVHHGHQSLNHHVKRMVLTGVADSRSLCSDKLPFSQNVLCGMSLQRCVEQPDHGQPHLIRSNKACGAAGRVLVIHWISTEE